MGHNHHICKVSIYSRGHYFKAVVRRLLCDFVFLQLSKKGSMAHHKAKQHQGRITATVRFFELLLVISFIGNLFLLRGNTFRYLRRGPPNEEQRKLQLETRRRTRAVICGHHSTNVISWLKDGFKFKEVGWDSEWDIVYGGYPHCGKQDTGYLDWKMEFGLNKHLAEKGWNNLKPHQVWFPCMGCNDSYCEKNHLCKLLREIDPSACYALPQDLERLKLEMGDGSKTWVLKRDGSNLHLHAGTGITYIKEAKELPEDLSDGSYLVQPYLEPYLGPSEYRRKAELRIYLTVTSVDPLRVYMYQRIWVQLAGSLYSDDINNKCIHDNHAGINGACDYGRGLTKEETQMDFHDYAKKTAMLPDVRDSLLRQTKELLARIIHGANPEIKRHVVNVGIKESGASCFSFMRADIGIAETGDPIVFEINEFPYTNAMAPVPYAILRDSHRDLFHMIGLDAPVIFGDQNRAAFEMANTGQWERLVPSNSTDF